MPSPRPAVTRSIRTAYTTLTGAVAAGHLPRARNAARYALRALGRAHLLPALAAPMADWRAVVEIVRLSIEVREGEQAAARALALRNAGAREG